MSNKETLQSYNNKLIQNNEDLQTVIDIINNLPDAGEGSGEDITDELTDYDAKLTTQEEQLVVIAEALKDKAAGGSTEPVVEPDYVADGLIAWWEGEDGFDENRYWNSRVGDDYISVPGYSFGAADSNNAPHSKDGAVYNDGVFSMVTQVDYCKTGYTVQIVGYAEGSISENTTEMCTLIGFNMSSSPMIGLRGTTYMLWTSNGYLPTHEVAYNNLNKRIFNASLSLNTAPTRSSSVSTPLDNSYSLNGGAWKSSSLSSVVHNSQGNNMTVLCYYTASNRAVGARIHSIRVYNRKLTEEELQHNFEIDKARFNIEELE